MMHKNDPLYFDHNATTPVDPGVVDAMLPWLQEHFGNPSSSHVYGRRAKAAVEGAREQVSRLLGCRPEEIYFTSGGTEANNIAIVGGSEAAPEGRAEIVTSTVEHPATAHPCEGLSQCGWNISRLPVDAEGQVSGEDLLSLVSERTALLTVMHANNETGTIMPIGELSEIAHARGALVHSDAAQSAGKIPVDVDALGVDFLSLAGHKLYAPKGVGALYVRRGTPVEPVLLGAGHEGGLRPGTENVPYIVGLGKACEIAADSLQADFSRLSDLRDRLFDLLRAEIPSLKLNGHPKERLPNTLNVSFPSVSGNELLASATQIAASTGSACHAGGESPSSVLLAMGMEPVVALGATRFSIGRGTTETEIDGAARILIRAWRELSDK